MAHGQADRGTGLGGGRVALAQDRHRQSARQDDRLHISRQPLGGESADLIALLASQEAVGRDHDCVAWLKSQSGDLQLNIRRRAAWPRAPT